MSGSVGRSRVLSRRELKCLLFTVPTFRPEGFTITPKPSSRDDVDPEAEGEANPAKDKMQHFDHPVPKEAGRGMNYQAE